MSTLFGGFRIGSFNLKILNWNFYSSLTDPHTVRDPTGCECATTNLVELKHRAERFNSVDSTLLIWEHFEQTSPNITFWEFSVFPDPEYCAMQHSPEQGDPIECIRLFEPNQFNPFKADYIVIANRSTEPLPQRLACSYQIRPRDFAAISGWFWSVFGVANGKHFFLGDVSLPTERSSISLPFALPICSP